MRALGALVAIGLAAGTAHADFGDFGGVAWMHYELQELHALDDTMIASVTVPNDLVTWGARLGGSWGKRVGLPVQFDFQLGSTIGKSGFAYEVSLLPVGLSVRPTERSMIVLAFGVSANGAIGTIDDAIGMPLELNAEGSLGPLRLLARGRASWLFGADARNKGSPTASWTDEIDATVGVRFGSQYTKWGLASGNGYFVGASYREMAGVKFAGLVIGYSIDGGTRTSRSSDDSVGL